MDGTAPSPQVHFYDTELHRILCGVRGFEGRSTKHARGVTCGRCIGLLGAREPAHADAGQSP
jgi:hypothetical protein